MADLTDQKPGMGAVFPVGQTDGAHGRLEPLVDADQLIDRALFGQPLFSQLVDPLKQTVAAMTPAQLLDLLNGAVSDLEVDAHCCIYPATRKERHAFHLLDWSMGFGYFQLRGTPVTAVVSLTIESSDGANFFSVPNDWVETGKLAKGELHILPLSPASAASSSFSGVAGGPAAALYFTHLARMQWIPAYFTIEFVSGFKDLLLPRFVNDLIAKKAAVEVLGMLGATWTGQSKSLGLDGISQSSSLPSPQVLQARIDKLEEQIKKNVKKLKAMYNQTIVIGAV